MQTPLDPLVATMLDHLDPNLREDFEERAGIMEFDAKLPRGHAECLALLDVLRRHPTALTGVIILQIELDRQTQWLLTTDPNYARQHLAYIGGIELGVLDLADVIKEQYGGTAMLATFG